MYELAPFDFWSGGDQGQGQWDYGDGGDWNGIRSLGFFGPAHAENERHFDEHAPIVSAATVDGLAPIGVPLTEVLSAASGCKSISASSNRFSAFALGEYRRASAMEEGRWYSCTH